MLYTFTFSKEPQDSHVMTVSGPRQHQDQAQDPGSCHLSQVQVWMRLFRSISLSTDRLSQSETL